MKTDTFRASDSAILAEINAQHTPATWDAAAHDASVDTVDFLTAKLAAAHAAIPLTADEIRSLPHRASSDLSDMPSALVALTGDNRQIDDGASRYFVPIRVGVITAALTGDHMTTVAAIVATRKNPPAPAVEYVNMTAAPVVIDGREIAPSGRIAKLAKFGVLTPFLAPDGKHYIVTKDVAAANPHRKDFVS